MTGLPRRVVFFHVPKCGGSSIFTDLRARIARRSVLDRIIGRRHAVLLHTKYHAEQLALLCGSAGSARFVHGHFDWDTYQSFAHLGTDYRVTFLRRPVARLLSDLRYFGSEQGWRYSGLPGRPEDYDAKAFLEASAERRRWSVDNVMVRTFSGTYDASPSNDADWSALLDTAKKNLDRFSRIGLVEQMDQHYGLILNDLGIGFQGLRSVNVSDEKTVHLDRSSGDMLEEFTRWDEELYTWAALRTASQFPLSP